MKIAQLEALLKVVETGSFSNAALDLDQAQSAVSYNVSELERELGIKLLERGRFGAKESDPSKEIVPHIRAIQQHIAAIEQISGSYKKGAKGIEGKLKIATFRSAGGRIVPPIIMKLRKKHPKLSFEFISSDLLDHEDNVLLTGHHADIAFFEYDLPLQDDSKLLTWEVKRDPYKVITVTDDPRESFTWDDIASETLIMDEADGCAKRVHRHMDTLGLSNKPLYEVQSDSTIVRMASEGLGIGVLPELAIDEPPKTAKIVEIEDGLERGIGVSILPSMLKVPAIRIFLTYLKEMYPESDVPSLGITSK